jgi:hypothetical protein
MSLLDKIKRIFTKSSTDDLFVPVEYSIRPHTEKVKHEDTEYVNDLFIEETDEHIETTVEETQYSKNWQVFNAPNYKTTYRINIDTGVQEKLFYKYIVYLTSADANNNNKEYTSYCIIQGDQIYGVSKSMQLFVLEREIYSLCTKHSNLIEFELPSDFKLQLINELRKIILV